MGASLARAMVIVSFLLELLFEKMLQNALNFGLSQRMCSYKMKVEGYSPCFG
jgi:hypothetical protein